MARRKVPTWVVVNNRASRLANLHDLQVAAWTKGEARALLKRQCPELGRRVPAGVKLRRAA